MRKLTTKEFRDVLEIIGDLFDYSVIVIPTNGVVKDDGRLVMGAGVAKQAKDRFRDIDLILGKKVASNGNYVHVIDFEFDKIIFSFPTKHHYNESSDIKLIEKSIKQLCNQTNWCELNEVYLPRVGCGLGNLDWITEVKPLLSGYLDDRFIIVTKDG